MTRAKRRVDYKWATMLVGLVATLASACSFLTDWEALSNEPNDSGGIVAHVVHDGTAPADGTTVTDGDAASVADGDGDGDATTVTDEDASHDGVILGSKALSSSYWYNEPPGVPADAYQYVAYYTGSIRTISFFLDGRTSARATVQVGLYSGSSASPGTLLTSGTVASAVPNAWNTVTVSATPVIGGQKYWLAFLIPNGVGTLSLRVTTDGELAVESAPDLPALPGTWTTKTTHNGSPASAFALP